MSLTDDPNDPRLTRGADETPVPQAPAYLVLSDEERAKGFVRPVRRSYVHDRVGGEHGACGATTTMAQAIAETYAAQPDYYGSTYCTGCGMHRPVAEFAWTMDGTRVGS